MEAEAAALRKLYTVKRAAALAFFREHPNETPTEDISGVNLGMLRNFKLIEQYQGDVDMRLPLSLSSFILTERGERALNIWANLPQKRKS